MVVSGSLSLWLVVSLVPGVSVAPPSGVLQKCLFDEVQSQVRVVRASESGRSDRTLMTSDAGRSFTAPQPIRIHTWITRESESLSEAERERLVSAVEEAVRRVSALLSVDRIVGPLLLGRDVGKYCKFLWSDARNANYNRCARANVNYRRETCLDVTIPEQHLSGCEVFPDADSPHRTVLRPEGSGLADTDFLLYLLIRSTDKCRAQASVLAYAVHCHTDAGGRPVSGVVVVCRRKLAREHQGTVLTLIHELLHALGFSKHLFHTWRDCRPAAEGGAVCSPQRSVVHADASGQSRIYTPSVLAVLHRHLTSSDPALTSSDPELGAPLENLQVPAGAASSHWESRLLQGSIMAAVLQEPSLVRVDPLTLAALQDTGWYRVDLGQVQSLVWGEGEGPSFGSLSSCADQSSSFFCSGSGPGCHFLHLHKGECQTDPYLEGCRVFKPLNNRSECWKAENAESSSGNNRGAELWGFHSRCFFSNLSKQFPVSSSSVEGRCYSHRCVGPNRYQVQVSGSDWVDCPAGGTVQISGYEGVVFCPDRRLCFYPDVGPPSDDPLPPADPSDPSETPMTSAQNGPWTERTVASSLGATAAACLLAAAAASYSYRKCRPQRGRTHPSHC